MIIVSENGKFSFSEDSRIDDFSLYGYNDYAVLYKYLMVLFYHMGGTILELISFDNFKQNQRMEG